MYVHGVQVYREPEELHEAHGFHDEFNDQQIILAGRLQQLCVHKFGCVSPASLISPFSVKGCVVTAPDLWYVLRGAPFVLCRARPLYQTFFRQIG